MLTNEQRYVLDCLRCGLCQGGRRPDGASSLDEIKIQKIIQQNGILLTVYKCVSPEIQEKLGKQYHMLLKQAILQDHEGKRIIEKLHEVGMRCVGLKGWELRRLYPEITMRQMTDIDLLIAPYDFASIREIFSSLQFTSYACEGVTKHDTFKKNTVSIEAHKRITESADSEILAWEKGIWDRALPAEDGSLKISNEDLYLHHMIHMHCDFRNGKLGLRRIADTWILQNMEMNWKQVDRTLEKLELSTFNERMARLSRACFGGEPMDDQSEYLLRYACEYGIYGTEKSYKAARVVARGSIDKGKTRALKEAILPPYERMKVLYPQLRKCPALIPYYWMKRLVKKSRKYKKNIQKLDYSIVSAQDYEDTARFLAAGGCQREMDGEK